MYRGDKSHWTTLGKKPSWLHHKLEAEVGSEDGLTDEELLQFKGALCDLADRIKRGQIRYN